MHLVVPNLTEQDCVVLDSTAVSSSGLDETEMDWGVTDCTALYCTWLDWTRLLLTYMDLGYPRLKFSKVEVNEWNWMGTNRFERDGNRLHLNDWTGLNWTGVHVSGVAWTGLDWTEPDSISEDWTGRSLPEFHFTRLHYTALYRRKVPYRTVSSLHLARLMCTELQCTFPNETEKDCTALHVNVLHWTRPRRRALHSAGSKLKDCSGLPKLQWSLWQYINLHLTFMQKTTNRDGWCTDVLRKDKLNKHYFIKLVSVSII